MSLRFLLHILFLRKWYILTALIGAPLIAGIFLLFAEPIYVSRCKVVLHDRTTDTDPLRENRPIQKDDTYIQTQVQLIFTDNVMAKVVDRCELVPPPPGQAPYIKLFGIQPKVSPLSPELQKIDAVRTLKSRVTADPLNPMELVISTEMNTPELARKITRCVLEVYKEEYGRMQTGTVDLVDEIKSELDLWQMKVDEADRDLQDFYKTNIPTLTPAGPQLALPPKNVDTLPAPAPRMEANGNGSGDGSNGKPFTPSPEGVSPLLNLRQLIVQLEMDLIKIEAREKKDSYAYRNAENQLNADKKLLESEERKLADQIRAGDRERTLIWRRETFRAQYSTMLADYNRAKQNMKIKQQVSGAVTVQDEATFDPQPIFPKRTLIMLASAFVGLVLGLGMAYLAHVLDSTYHLPEDYSADTGLPVLAAIPYGDASLGLGGVEAAAF